ncbi:hypothetical protein N3K66_007133 [Trichothecium roseum]|uniref:Uncharacterized protein n=1 Tax=Trichothecium roseum TaxID=47278 RepID=A0ACC0UZW2_9HYPO|nr:hypothetical protein N3K66_007133 [Trichothecium roseum]
MSTNILVTGAAGYIGGSVVASFAAQRDGPLSKATIHAAVRSDEQAESLSALAAVKVLQADLYDGEAMEKYVVENKSTKTSGGSTFDTLTGWPYGDVKDTDAIFKMEKELGEGYAQRKTDVAAVEQSQAHGVKTVIVMPVNIYGRGSGTWNRMSLHIPGYIRAAVKHRRVYKFADSRVSPLVHIDELSDFYVRLASAILRGDGDEAEKTVGVGEDGFVFVQSHRTPWWDILDALAGAMHARGLVDEPRVATWPSPEVMTEALEVPAAYAYSIWNSEAFIQGVKAKRLGWEPTWSTERLLANLDAEIDAALDPDANKTSLIRSIRNK